MRSPKVSNIMAGLGNHNTIVLLHKCSLISIQSVDTILNKKNFNQYIQYYQDSERETRIDWAIQSFSKQKVNYYLVHNECVFGLSGRITRVKL